MEISFIPRKDSELHSFESNFITKLPLHTTTLKLDPAEVAATTEIIGKNINAYNTMVFKKAEAKSLTAEFKVTKKAALKEIRRMSKMIKASMNYTITEGEDLQIISPKPAEPAASEMQPVLKIKVNGHVADIRYNKGRSTALNIYSKRGSETEFKFLAITTEVQYQDDRVNIEPGKPEKREYYAFFKEKDKEIGLKSDIVDVIVP
jgi:hypothetical protein